MSPAFAPDVELITTIRRQDIDAMCPRCKDGEAVKRFVCASGSAWSHTASHLDHCPAEPIWELTIAEVTT